MSNRRLLPSSLETRLLGSYLAVFASVLAVMAIIVHFAFAAALEREVAQRLNELANVGISVADVSSRFVISVDLHDQAVRAVDSRTAGILWRDAAGHRLASYGIPPGPQTRTMTRAASVGDVQRQNVIVQATVESPVPRSLRIVDAYIAIAFLLALAGSVVAGRWLTRKLVSSMEANLRTQEQFTEDAAHELRGPLAVVAANAAQAVPFEGGYRISAPAMNAITGAATQMTRLSDDLLTLARARSSLEPELFAADLGELAQTAAGLYDEEAALKGVKLEIDVREGIQVYGTPEHIVRIIANLVQNAVRYTAAGGTVTVTCRRERDGAVVRVSDTGIGIAFIDLDRVFERFWRGDRSRSTPGSGLGLTIVQELARRHGAHVGIDSRAGEGTCVAVTFPARPPQLRDFP